MSELPHNGDRRTSASKYVWVCLLLPLLFLCNPFLLTPAESAGGLSMLHPPSYRATVASSELLKFKNPEHLDTSTIADCKEFVGFQLFQLQLSAPRVSAEELLPAVHSLSGNVWFRPPPAA
jgi:hypothetical protein